MHHWHVYPDFQQATVAAAAFVTNTIRSCLEQHDECHVILPGGNTPLACLKILQRQQLDWQRVHWYPGDERCYPAGHAERNDSMLYQGFISQLGETHFHPIPAELGAEQAALEYQQLVDTVERFDLAFLGMGEDGHTASLFPGNAALHINQSVVAVHDAPKPPADRVSFSIKTLSKVPYKLVLASGAGKAAAIQQIQAGGSLPVNCLGDIHWYLDSDALPATEGQQ